MAVHRSFLVLILSIVTCSICLSSHIHDINKEVVNGSGLDEKQVDDAPKVVEDKTWAGFPELGQVAAVSVDGDGNLHIFHRGDRIWDSETFDRRNLLAKREQGPIANDTVLVVDPSTGKVLYSWGANRFYMPHGMKVDHHGNTWITDVGLHQVFKFSPRDNILMLELGEAFVPGDDGRHFCKPTDVAVTAAGYFFVSDGYCNSRILMYSQGGRLLKEIGPDDGMTIPHSLTLIPDFGAICVADRENGRLLCYSSGMDGTMPGEPLAAVEGEEVRRVYAVDKRGDQFFIVNGADLWKGSQSEYAKRGVIIDIMTGRPRGIWGPEKGFDEPHDIAVSPDGKNVYVAEVKISAPKKVYKFTIAN